MASRIVLACTAAAIALSIALPTWGASSINTTQPANGVPYSPAPIRLNFQAAANDINALQSLNAGASPPSNPSPGAWWLDTSGNTTYELKIWDGRGNAWLHVATLDTINNIWVPPVGGGLLPTILSAATTNIGSVPQASLYISGNNSIQSLGTSAPVGAIKFLIFTGTATLVNVPGQLSLPNGIDLTQQAGDTAVALQVASGNWQIIFDSRSAGSGIQSRTFLTATQNLFVATTGSDANNNCTNNLGPCQTIQHAVNVALTNYDLGGQSLLVNVANGTYAAGAAVAGQPVGGASALISQTQFPITGLQIIGNPTSPSSVVIADTSFNPATFLASAGTYYTVSGFTVSSANGFGILSQSGSTVLYGSMVFGNTALAQVAAKSNSIANAIAGYTVAGNAPSHLESQSGGFVRIATPSPITINLSGAPTFSVGFVYVHDHATAIINSGQTSFSGAIVGPQYLVRDSSTLSTEPSNSPSYLPGSIQGAVLDYSSFYPPMEITTFPTATGLGVGGFASPNPTLGMYPFAGTVLLNTGTSGTADNGQVTFNQPTHQYRTCVSSLGAGWDVKATIQTTLASSLDQTSIIWDNNGIPLTTSVQYSIHYICAGMHP